MINGAVRPKTKSKPRPLHLAVNLPIVIVCALMLLFGFLMVASSSGQLAVSMDKPITHFLGRQVLFAFAGLIIAAALYLVNYQTWAKFIIFGVVAVAILMLIARFSPKTAAGATRGIWEGSIQPAEFAKLIVVIYLAIWITSRKDDLNSWGLGFLPLIVIVGFMAGLAAILPDYSASATIFLLGIMMFFLGGGQFLQLIVSGAAMFVAAFGVYFVNDTIHNRLSTFFFGIMDPTRSAEQVRWAFEAIINGGIFGMGIGRSLTKYLGLPVAHTDSIFAIIIEETGLIGALFVIACFVFLLWSGLKVARQAPDPLGKLLAQGITFWIVIEAAINMGTMVGIVPIAGNTLPLISYGGSSLVTTMAAIGILLNISRQGLTAKAETEGGTYGAVIDLRRGDRRRSISRPSRPAGTQR